MVSFTNVNDSKSKTVYASVDYRSTVCEESIDEIWASRYDGLSDEEEDSLLISNNPKEEKKSNVTSDSKSIFAISLLSALFFVILLGCSLVVCFRRRQVEAQKRIAMEVEKKKNDEFEAQILKIAPNLVLDCMYFKQLFLRAYLDYNIQPQIERIENELAGITIISTPDNDITVENGALLLEELESQNKARKELNPDDIDVALTSSLLNHWKMSFEQLSQKMAEAIETKKQKIFDQRDSSMTNIDFKKVLESEKANVIKNLEDHWQLKTVVGMIVSDEQLCEQYQNNLRSCIHQTIKKESSLSADQETDTLYALFQKVMDNKNSSAILEEAFTIITTQDIAETEIVVPTAESTPLIQPSESVGSETKDVGSKTRRPTKRSKSTKYVQKERGANIVNPLHQLQPIDEDREYVPSRLVNAEENSHRTSKNAAMGRGSDAKNRKKTAKQLKAEDPKQLLADLGFI